MLIIHMFPVFLANFFAIILNIYLTIKAYQIHKKIQDQEGSELKEVTVGIMNSLKH